MAHPREGTKPTNGTHPPPAFRAFRAFSDFEDPDTPEEIHADAARADIDYNKLFNGPGPHPLCDCSPECVELLHRTDRRRQQHEAAAAIGIGTQTLASLPDGPAAPPILDPFLTPDGVAVFYGPGGVGKGMLCVYLAKRLVEAGHTVMIVDYESHDNEWGRRARAMGFTDDQLRTVHYRAPFGEAWKATENGSLSNVARLIQADCDRLGVTYLIVDSFAAATSNGEAMGGMAAADEFFAAIRTIHRPAAVIAHVAGGGQRFPDKAFGSIYIHNFARETWAVESASEADDIPFDHDTHKLQPSILALELRNKKVNVGSKPPPQFITFSFFRDGTIEVDPNAKSKRLPLREIAIDILRRAGTAMTTKSLAKAIHDEDGRKVDPDTLRKTLSRPDPSNRSRLLTESDTHPRTWSFAQ